MSSALARGQVQTTATIADGQTKSGAVATGEFAMGGFTTPSTFEGTTMSFEVSLDDSTFVPLKNDAGGAISMTVAVSCGYPLPPEIFAFKSFKFVSGAAASGAARVLGVSLKS